MSGLFRRPVLSGVLVCVFTALLDGFNTGGRLIDGTIAPGAPEDSGRKRGAAAAASAVGGADLGEFTGLGQSGRVPVPDAAVGVGDSVMNSKT